MPKVGKMKFPYSEQGIKEAASYARNSGKPMQVEGNYRHGGMVPKYQAGGMVPNRQMNPRLRYGLGNRVGGGPRPQMGPGMGTGRPMGRPMSGAGRGMNPRTLAALAQMMNKKRRV